MLKTFLNKLPLLPILTTDCQTVGLKAVNQLVELSIKGVEITLRTPNALPIIETIKKQYPKLTVAAGTVVNAEQLKDVFTAGADFAISPGFCENLINTADANYYPYLPAISTIGEAMRAQILGVDIVKVFPVTLLGGTAFINYLNAVLPKLNCVPTGGIKTEQWSEYQALNNVLSVGMSVSLPNRFDNTAWEGLMENLKKSLVPEVVDP